MVTLQIGNLKESPTCHNMFYPTLFPRGDINWHNSMHVEEPRTAPGMRLSMQQFYGYRMAI